MANARWKMDRKRRDDLAAKDPVFTGLRISRRIIVIYGEKEVKEATIYESDSRRSASRKIREVMTKSNPNEK